MVPWSQDITNLSFDLFFNSETLNCFSDASMKKTEKGGPLATCAGSIAVCKDNIISDLCTITSECTVPAAELRGIRNSLTIALANRNNFRVINLFSDSQISVFAIRDFIHKWRYDFNAKCYYLGNNPVKNQEIIIECLILLDELQKTNFVNIFHQSGHVKNSIDDIRHSIEVFKKSNSINCKVDYNFARYISTWNNYIDDKTRSIIRNTNVKNTYYCDPIIFNPSLNLSLQNQI